MTMPPMRYFAKLLLVAVLVSAALRLVWVAWPMTTAPSLLRVQLQNATLGWIGLGHRDIRALTHVEQAEYWLAETDRVFQQHPTSETARGAAWILYSPTLPAGYYSHGLGSTRMFGRMPLSDEATAKADEFAELAKQLAPDDPRPWRTQMSMQSLSAFWRVNQYSNDLSILKLYVEASQRDPDNSMPSFYATQLLWQSSTIRQLQTLDVFDREKFARGMAELEQGLQKLTLAMSVDELKTVKKLLEESKLPWHEHAAVLESRGMGHSEWNALQLLVSFQLQRLHSARGDDELDILGQNVLLTRQLQQTFEPVLETLADTLLAESQASLSRRLIGVSEPSPKEAPLVANVRELLEHRALLQSARSRMAKPTTPPTMLLGEPATAAIAVTALPLAFALLTIWLSLRALAHWWPAHEDAPEWRFGVAWRGWSVLLGVALSIVLLGLAPAGVINAEAQDGAAQLALALVPAIFVCSLFFVMLRHRNSQRVVLALLVTVPLVGAVFTRVNGPLLHWITSGLAVHVPEIRAEKIETQLQLAFQPLKELSPSGQMWQWSYPALQWLGYQGPLSAFLFAMVFIGVWYWVWATWRRADTRPARRVRWRGVCDQCSRLAKAGALAALLAFLLTEPDLLRRTETNYRETIGEIAATSTRAEQMSKAMKQLRTDAVLMQSIQEFVDNQLQMPPTQLRLQ